MITSLEDSKLEDVSTETLLRLESMDLKIARVATLEPPIFDATRQVLRPISHLLANLLMPVREYPILIGKMIDEGSPAQSLLGNLGITADRLEELNSALVGLCHGEEGEPVLIDVGCLLDRLLAEFRIESGSSVEFVTKFAPCFVRAPYDTLETAFRHLLRNAIAAMPSGGQLVVDVSAAVEVDVAARFGQSVAGPAAIIAFSDTGVGFAEAVGERLFEPFATGCGEGLGVGLSLVYRAVRCAGGFIAYAAEPDLGARFCVVLPACDGGGDESGAC